MILAKPHRKCGTKNGLKPHRKHPYSIFSKKKKKNLISNIIFPKKQY